MMVERAVMAEENRGLISMVFDMIKANSGRIQIPDILKVVGDRKKVRYALARLQWKHQVKRKKILGQTGIEYVYVAAG